MVVNNDKDNHQEQSIVAEVHPVNPTNFRQEFFWLILILIAGLLPRLIFISVFPSLPVSDFRGLLDFSIYMRDAGPIQNGWFWWYFSPGLPLIFSGILRIFHGAPEVIGRWTTALFTGVIPVLPYLIWKDVFRLRTRMIAALLLALWPGQILFSGVFAQDNWILFPTVALSALAVRTLILKKDGNPILAALLYGVTVSIRQEMMIALIPVLLVTILGGRAGKRIHNLLIGGFLIIGIFTALILLRGLATGRYALTTEHFGKSVLGAYVPGAGIGWQDPVPYMNAVHPEWLENHPEVMKSGIWGSQVDHLALNLAWHEFLRRPGFHLVRIFASTLTHLFGMDEGVAYWSLTAEGVLPVQYHNRVLSFMTDLSFLRSLFPFLIHTLFATLLFFAFRHREYLKWISPILATIVLKIGIHAVLGSQPRYYMVVIALEFLTMAILTEEFFKVRNSKIIVQSLIIGISSIFIMSLLATQAKDFIQTHDELSPSTSKSTFIEVANDFSVTYGGARYFLHDNIPALYSVGFNSGCRTIPLVFCPNKTLTSAEAAVFIFHGLKG